MITSPLPDQAFDMCRRRVAFWAHRSAQRSGNYPPALAASFSTDSRCPAYLSADNHSFAVSKLQLLLVDHKAVIV